MSGSQVLFANEELSHRAKTRYLRANDLCSVHERENGALNEL